MKHVFIINTDKDADRLQDIYTHLDQWGVEPIRFPAVTGVSLPALSPSMSELKHVVSLNLSHAAVSRHCLIGTQLPHWLVLEDDCRFLVDPRKIVADVLGTLGSKQVDWSVVSLGCISHEWQGVRPPPGGGYDKFTLEHPKGWFPWGSHAYLVNRKHAARLVAMWSSCFYPADHALLEEYKNGTGFLLRPSAAYQEEYPSYQTGGGGINESKRVADLPPEIIEKICSVGPPRRDPPLDFQV